MRGISAYEKYGSFRPETDANLIEHTFNVSETLDGLAHFYYGDRTKWTVIADRNGIVDARKIAPGTRLLIPELQPETGDFQSA
jgi:nucleoid-associated protein YgaU